MSALRRWLGRALLLLASLLLATLAGELLLRAWLPPIGEYVMPGGSLLDTSIFAYRILPVQQAPPGMEQLTVGLVPNTSAEMRTLEYSTTVRVNSLGLRGPELAPKAAGELRLLAIGDSFTLAIQHDEDQTWEARLGRGLSERLGRPVSVLNGGVDSVGTEVALSVMNRVVPAADVDAVLLTFYTGNDFTDNRPMEDLIRTMGRGEVFDPSSAPPPPEEALGTGWGALLGRHSYIYTYYQARLEARKLAADPAATAAFREHLMIFGDPAQLRRAAPFTARLLRQYGDDCRRLRVDCYLAVAPPSFAVHTERLATTWETYGLGDVPADLDAPTRAVLAAAPGDLPTLDLSAPLRAASGRELYFTFDGHWNARGSEVVAEALTDWLAPRLEE